MRKIITSIVLVLMTLAVLMAGCTKSEEPPPSPTPIKTPTSDEPTPPAPETPASELPTEPDLLAAQKVTIELVENLTP